MISEISIKKHTVPFKKSPQQLKKMSFGAGSVKLYSDFDRTFLPLSHQDFKNSTPQNNSILEEYFNTFRIFFQNTAKNLEFNITTGRNLIEFNTMLYIARLNGFHMPLPRNLTTKNGADNFFNKDSEDNFYLKHKSSPYQIQNRDESKIDEIKKKSNWDGKQIKLGIKEILTTCNFEIIEPETTNNPKHYGIHTLFNYFEDKFNPDSNTEYYKSPWVASLRQDGDLSIHIGLPKDISFSEDRINRIKELNQKIADFLDENNVKYNCSFLPNDKECGNHPSITIVPCIDNCTLSKLYDPLQAVQKALKENDLVVVAGDSSNDFEMLNPINYLNTLSRKDVELFNNDPHLFIKAMELNPELAEQFHNLPFMGIIVRNHLKEESLDKLLEYYGEGPYKKIICVKEGHLLDGIRQSIQLYSNNNSNYKAKMDKDFKKQIEGI